MFSKLFIAGLAAVMQVGLAVADNHVSCQWIPDGEVCIASVDSPAGEKYTAFQLQLAICSQNSSPSGCAEALPGVCKSVTVTGLGLSVCLPELGPDTLAPQDTLRLADIKACVGDPSPNCNDVRASFYEVLGCPECVGPANEAAPFEEACIAANGKAACAAASPKGGAAPKPANATAPAAVTPAPTPAPAPAAVVPAAVPAATPAATPVAAEMPAGGDTEEGAVEGADAVEGSGADEAAGIEEEGTSGAAAATAAVSLLAAAAAAMLL